MLLPILIILAIILGIGFVFFRFLEARIHRLETHIVQTFTSRTDVFPALYEVSRGNISRSEDIFAEVFSMRKKEFILLGMTQTLETFLQLEQEIHHEVNFIFQVCNKNPKLNKDKHFLYIRDIIIERSQDIGVEMKKYKRIIEIYNTFIQVKNYSLIGFILPFSKKVVL